MSYFTVPHMITPAATAALAYGAGSMGFVNPGGSYNFPGVGQVSGITGFAVAAGVGAAAGEWVAPLVIPKLLGANKNMSKEITYIAPAVLTGTATAAVTALTQSPSYLGSSTMQNAVAGAACYAGGKYLSEFVGKMV